VTFTFGDPANAPPPPVDTTGGFGGDPTATIELIEQGAASASRATGAVGDFILSLARGTSGDGPTGFARGIIAGKLIGNSWYVRLSELGFGTIGPDDIDREEKFGLILAAIAQSRGVSLEEAFRLLSETGGDADRIRVLMPPMWATDP